MKQTIFAATALSNLQGNKEKLFVLIAG